MSRKRAEMPERILTAHHEAGHAAFAVVVGRELDYITIVSEPCEGGVQLGYTHCVAMSPDYQPTEHDVLVNAIQAMGGAMAEARLIGRHTDGASEDLGYARQLLAQLTHRDLDQLIEKQVERAHTLMHRDDVWRGVQALARALLKRGRIEGAEATQIIDDAMGVRLRITP